MKKILIVVLILATFVAGWYMFFYKTPVPTFSSNSNKNTDIPDLPPDPGEAGKATIEGIDSDNDGVRDDIQRYVGLAFPADPEVRMTLMRLADSQQQYLTARNSELGVVQAIVDMVRAWN